VSDALSSSHQELHESTVRYRGAQGCRRVTSDEVMIEMGSAGPATGAVAANA